MSLAGRTAWRVFAVAVAVNLVLLFWPQAPGTPGGLPLDKVVHLLSFAAVTWSGARAGLAIRWLVAVLTVHAVTSELIQHALLPGRSGDPADVLADLTGVAGVVLALGAASWRDGRAGRDGWDGRDGRERDGQERERDDGAAARRQPRAR